MNNPPFPFVTITNPCAEDWQNMTIAEKGRFCASCQKKVHDFTNANSEEIRKHYHETEGNTCGRFTVTQLINYNKEAAKKQDYLKRIHVFCLAVLLAFGSSLFCITSLSAKNWFTNLKKAYSFTIDQEKTDNKEDFYIITGKVIDNTTKEGIPNAEIQRMSNDSLILTKTNSDGNFKIKIPKINIKEGDKLNLYIHATGYNLGEQEITVNTQKLTINLIRTLHNEYKGGPG